MSAYALPATVEVTCETCCATAEFPGYEGTVVQHVCYTSPAFWLLVASPASSDYEAYVHPDDVAPLSMNDGEDRPKCSCALATHEHYRTERCPQPTGGAR